MVVKWSVRVYALPVHLYEMAPTCMKWSACVCMHVWSGKVDLMRVFYYIL